jgi:hypothetical protein
VEIGDMSVEVKIGMTAGFGALQKEVVRQTKYAIKYAVDIAANNTRNLMEKEAKSKFSLSKPWTSAKQPSGYRARNSYVNGKIAPDIPTSGFDRRTGDILAAAYSGERNYW